MRVPESRGVDKQRQPQEQRQEREETDPPISA
jgi:hypothetical protein